MRRQTLISLIPDVPWYVSVFIIIVGLALLALLQYFREPVFMKDCMDAGYTQAQCEMQWKWRTMR